MAPQAQTVRGWPPARLWATSWVEAWVGAWACVLGLGCAAGPVPCGSPSQCGTGSECLAHRCVALGSDPVAAGSLRLVLDAEQVAVVHAERHATGTGLPSTVTFGGPPATSQELLLRFPRGWATLEIDSAFLLLEPAPDADPTGADVPVRVALAAAAWTPGSAPRAPGERGPHSSGLARTRPPSVLRVDVTAQLQALQAQAGRRGRSGQGRSEQCRSEQGGSEQGGSDYGLVVRAEGGTERGATYQTGAEGVLPRLDVYGRVPGTGAD